MEQKNLFDAAESEAAKEAGVKLASENRPNILTIAREIARRISTDQGITADDVVRELVDQGYGVHCLGNAAGSLFRGGEWVSIGFRKSTRVHAHSNLLRVWRLK